MTEPEINFWLIFIVQALGFGSLWLKNKQQTNRIRMLWADYKILHKIKENGDPL
jgi:hypothetical protein